MSNRRFPDDVERGDKVCFKNIQEKKDYELNACVNLDGVVYGIILEIVSGNRGGLEVDWINHKGIIIRKRCGVYFSRLKFYDAE